jgi:pyruvate dehydrogenase E1 component alpha subunit
MTESGRADEQLQVIARFEVRHRAYLAPDGSIHRRLPAFASDTRLLVRLYRAMVLVRAFDLKAVALQRASPGFPVLHSRRIAGPSRGGRRLRL